MRRKVTLKAGMRLPPRGTGDILNGYQMDSLLAFFNAFMNLQARLGTKAQLTVSDQNAILEIPAGIFGGSSTPTPGTGTGNMNYRGLWSGVPSTPYMVGDVVVIQAGTATGMYISSQDNNTNYPSTGTGWIQIGTNQGQWL